LPAQPMISMKYCQMLSQSKLLYLGRIVGIRMGPQPKSLGAARFAFQASSLIPSFMSVHKRTVSYLSASYLKIMSGAPFVSVHVRPLAQSFIESVEKPTKGTAQGVQQRHPVYYLFDHHYTLANRELQVLLKRPKTVQNIGPQRKRSDLNKGEDNAVYKAYFHSCIQCAGADDCANSLMYRPLLYYRPRQGRNALQRDSSTAWKARRYEISMLADRGASKREASRRGGHAEPTSTGTTGDHSKSYADRLGKARQADADGHCWSDSADALDWRRRPGAQQTS